MAHHPGYWVPENQVALYANKFSKKTYRTDVPTLWNELEVMRDRIQRRDREIAALKARNNRLESLIARIRQFI